MSNSLAASLELRRALHVYERAASRPRSSKAWSYVAQRLWYAREDARLAGVLTFGSQSWTFVTDRMHDAHSRA